MPEPTSIHVFSYGSNMSVPRMRDRVDTACSHTIGYVAWRKLCFHKRGVDGSAKANSMWTGCDGDRIWGVVYEISMHELSILDRHETLGVGYDRIEVEVIARGRSLTAHLYVALPEMIDDGLKPFHWYRDFVLHGARQHRLPDDYIDEIASHDAISDHDAVRAARNRQLIEP